MGNKMLVELLRLNAFTTQLNNRVNPSEIIVTPQIFGGHFFHFFFSYQSSMYFSFTYPKYMKLYCSNIFLQKLFKVTTRPSSYSRPRGSAVFLCT